MPATLPLSTVDAAWLGMEDPTNLMMVTGVLMLEGKVDLKRLMTVYDRRISQYGRFRQRIVRPRSRGGLPHWQDDPRFDIANHFSHVALPAPGGDNRLREMVSELMATPLDFTKPLWHVHVIEGYSPGSVILVRIHHCVADGIALVRVMLSLTDTTPNAPLPRAHKAEPNEVGRLDWLPDAIGRGVAAGQTLVTNPEKLGELARVGAHGAYRLGRLILLPPDPHTIFKGPLGRRKRAAWSAAVPLDDFKLIGKAFGATVNDVLVAAATGALRRYLEQRDQPTAGLRIRASVPVNLRRAEEAHKLGNAFGLVFLSLPVGIVNPVQRLRAIQHEMDGLKRSPEALVAFGVLNVLGMTPVEVEHLGVRFFGSKATAVLTNVPGPRDPLYLADKKVGRIMFWVPQSGRMGLGISILSYAGGVMLGVATDEGLVPDPESIVAGFELEFEALRKVALQRKRRRTGAGPRKQVAV